MFHVQCLVGRVWLCRATHHIAYGYRTTPTVRPFDTKTTTSNRATHYVEPTDHKRNATGVDVGYRTVYEPLTATCLDGWNRWSGGHLAARNRPIDRMSGVSGVASMLSISSSSKHHVAPGNACDASTQRHIDALVAQNAEMQQRLDAVMRAISAVTSRDFTTATESNRSPIELYSAVVDTLSSDSVGRFHSNTQRHGLPANQSNVDVHTVVDGYMNMALASAYQARLRLTGVRGIAHELSRSAQARQEDRSATDKCIHYIDELDTGLFATQLAMTNASNALAALQRGPRTI